MSQAEELLNTLSLDDVSMYDGATDEDPHIVIGADRFIIVPDELKRIAVQYDHNIRTVTFDCPRYYDGRDMSKMKVYINIAGPKGARSSYIADNVVVDAEDNTVMHFDWTITRSITEVKGNMVFLVCIRKADSEGNEENHWNSELCTDLYISEGMEYEETFEYEYPDIVTQLLQRMDAVEEMATPAAMQGYANSWLNEHGNEVLQGVINAGNQVEEDIDRKAMEALESIPTDYTESYNLSNEAARTKGDAVVYEVKGKVLTVTDSSDDYLRSLRVFGKTEQIKTTGKNLLNNTAETVTIEGIKYTINDDGSIVANGTATADSFLTIGSIAYTGGVTYKISGCPSNGSKNTYMLYAVYGTDLYAFDTGTGSTFTPESDITKSVSIKIIKGTAVSNLVFCPMVRIASVSDNTYEPYSGGVASPSPDWPQDLVSIENPKVEIVNKNLANLSTYSNTANYAALIDVVDLSLIKKGKTYTLSVWLDSEVDSTAYWNTSSKILKHTEFAVRVGLHRYTHTFTAVEDGINHTTRVNVLNKYPTNDNKRITASKAQIEEGSIATDHVKFDKQTIDITHPLHGIPVSQNGNYTDSNDQQWICDEVDFERGMYIQRVVYGSVPKTGWITERVDAEFYEYKTYESQAIYTNGAVLCSHFAGRNANRLVVGSNRNFYARFPLDSGIDTAEKAAAFFTNNDVKMVVALLNEIETPLTATELASFKYAHSNYPNTTVLNNSGAWMEMKYNVDTELFIKNTLGKPTDEQVNTAVTRWLETNFSVAEGVAY